MPILLRKQEMKPTKFKAGEFFPALSLATLGQGVVNLAKPQAGYDWRLVVVYRGQHCPLCSRYLSQLEELKQGLYDLGIDIIAVSADSQEQASRHMQQMTLTYPVAYGLDIGQMRQLGLYISEPRSARETDHPFAEPGLFVINSDGLAQLIDISNGPFARPELATLISGLGFIKDPQNNYPIRGTYGD